MAIENILEKTVVLPHNVVHILFDTSERFDETYINETREMLAECNECKPEDVTDDWIDDVFWTGLDDERMNLNIETGKYIIAYCDLGFWNRREKHLVFIGHNVKDIFDRDYSCDEFKFYCEGGDVKFEGSHHDGSHYITFRMVDDRLTYDELGEKLSSGELEYGDFIEQTESIFPLVANVYGW